MFQGRAMGGPVMVDSCDARVIRQLADCLQIVEDPQSFTHCNCLGGPTMELYAGPEHVATISLQHGWAIRWNQWYHDAQLRTGDRLTKWLHQQGIAPTRLEAIYHRGDNFLLAEPTALSKPQKELQRLRTRAHEHAQGGDLAAAVELLNRSLKLDPEQVEAYAFRSQLHYHAGNLAEAAADCSAAIDRGFRHAELYFIRAVALDSAGRREEALADCSMALHLNPKHAGAYNSRGLIRSQLDQFDEALKDLSEAIRLAPEWFLPYFNRAQLTHSQGQLDSSLTDYDLAIELLKRESPNPSAVEGNPTVAMLYCKRGDARRDRFRDAEADADFAVARRVHPTAAASYLGDLWLRRGEYDRAREAFTQLVQLRPNDAQGYLGRGFAHETLGDLVQASVDYSTAIRLQPDEGSGYLMRAQLRQRQGQTDDALADLSEHLRLHPTDASAYLIRASIHGERKARAAAIVDLDAAYEFAPDNSQVCNNLAWLLATCSDAKLRNGPRAVTLARKACEATDWKFPFCLGTLGAALAETGAFDEAIHWQTQALNQYPPEEKAAGMARLKLYQAGQPYRE
jgi:tetratricopeptide (TPR) repeat protein